MDERLRNSFVAGVERVAAWADLLDAINVFPIADGDTGRNLSVSLSPLRAIKEDKEAVIRRLMLSARGNSGNIASRFFSAFYAVDTESELKTAAKEASAKAWRAVADPRQGTMLSVFDALAEVLGRNGLTPGDPQSADEIVFFLEQVVRETQNSLPKLKQAGVVDAGALGMYIFFEGFFYTLAGADRRFRPITAVFKDQLKIAPTFQEAAEAGYCVDFVVKAAGQSRETLSRIAGTEESAIVIQEGDLYKIHLHTNNKDRIRSRLAGLGDVVNWEDDNLARQIQEFQQSLVDERFHIITDAAGSLTRDDARKYGFSLLSSYLNVGETFLPETCFQPDELYRAMREGEKVSTSQASVFERHQFYEAALARFEKVLYLCVGSVYTGNYAVAMDWKRKFDPDNRLTVLDTGAASGRLGTIVIATARYLSETKNMEKTIAFARRAIVDCQEYVFLEKLEYLAAGGRLSKASAFVGDMLRMKPVISPQPEGAKKVGVVRHHKEQIKMALEKLSAALRPDSRALVMLEYSDNLSQVREFGETLKARFPQADIMVQPLSLTSGAHMGPGTWGVAFIILPETGATVSTF